MKIDRVGISDSVSSDSSFHHLLHPQIAGDIIEDKDKDKDVDKDAEDEERGKAKTTEGCTRCFPVLV